MATPEKDMTNCTRVDVFNRMYNDAILPIFYHDDPVVACRIIEAVVKGGLASFEFLNRGDHAIEVFTEMKKYCRKNLPQVILGGGSITDEGTAAMYVAHGAKFIVSSSLNERVARFCNRRKTAYMPGCQTATEIAAAEEVGAEIVKLFPAKISGGPEFIRQILGPTPWTRIIATSLGEVGEETLAEWFDAGVAVVGMWPELIPPEAVVAGDFDAVTESVIRVRKWVGKARTRMN